MKLIQISYYFPPMHSMAVARMHAFASHFSRLFEQVRVITVQLPEGQQKDLSYPEIEGVEVTRIRKFDYRDLITRRSGKGEMHLPDAKRRNPAMHFLVRLVNTIPFNFFFGEGGLFYIRNAYREIRNQCRDNPPEVIFSSFRPYADHYIAWLVKRKYPQVKWIADFRDLHVDDLYKLVLFPQLQNRLTSRILRRASLVLTVSEGLAVSLRRLHPHVEVLTNPVVSQPVNTWRDKEGLFTVAYTGSLVGNKRDPSAFLEAVRMLDEGGVISPDSFRFTYAGKDGAQMDGLVRQSGLEAYFRNEGLVDREGSVSLQRRAHINLLLTSSIPEMRGILTGKLFEYLGGYNPIVCIINGTQDGIFEDLFDTYKLGCLVYHGQNGEAEKLKQYLLAQFKSWQNGTWQPDIESRQRAQADFSWEKRLPEILENL